MQRKAFILSGLCFLPVLAGLSGCGGGNIPAATPTLPGDTTRQVDALIESYIQETTVPGVVVDVLIPGRGQYITAQGKANLETGTTRDALAPFRIASITKTFIATAILQLADEGKLSTSDPLSKWYPDFPRATAITVDNLLRMRSGIADSAGKEFVEEYYADPTTRLTAEDMIARSAILEKDFIASDQKTEYANVNYLLLQRIIEKVSGQPVSVYVRENIFNRLGMANSYYATDTVLPGPNRGYSADLNGVVRDKTTLNPAPAGGAGAIVSTASDLRVYCRALYKGDLLKSATQATRLRAQTFAGEPDFVQYGQGITRLGKFYGHNGTIFGFSSEMWYLPERDAVIVISINRLDEDDQSESTELFLRLTKLLFPGDTNW